MFRIAICDDEELICSYIDNVIWNYCKKTKENFDVDIFCSGERLYHEMKNGTQYDLIFLDIDLRTDTGINIGNQIRDTLKNEMVLICYISAQETYAMQLFDIRPINFLIKPLTDDKILQVLIKAIELSNKVNNMFIYKHNRRTYKKTVKNILYFESMDRQIRMVSTDGDEIFYGSLKEIGEQLHKYNFITCHKSYLINYHHVSEFQYEQLVMSNGEIIPISQPQRKYIREYQMKYERTTI